MLFNSVKTCLAWLLLLYHVYAEYEPNVIKTDFERNIDLQVFDDTTVLLKVQDGKAFRSNDNGNSWKVLKDVKKPSRRVQVDTNFNRERAFIFSSDSKSIYITDDQGKSWKESLLADEDKRSSGMISIQSHPYSKDYLITHLSKCDNLPVFPPSGKRDIDDQVSDNANDGSVDDDKDKKKNGPFHKHMNCERFSYVSKDGGRSFSRVIAPSDNKDDDFVFKNTFCQFMKYSKDSTIDVPDASIACTYSKREPTRKNYMDFSNVITEFFISDDLGKTNKIIDSFKDRVVDFFRVLNSYIVALTRDDKHNIHSPLKVWISTDAINFEEAYVPIQVRTSNGEIYEDDLNRIILPVSNPDDNNDHLRMSASRLLRSDCSGMNFDLITWGEDTSAGYFSFQNFETLKGTQIVSFFSPVMSGGESNRGFQSYSKMTTDYGATWSNLRVLDPEHEFDCDASDTEHCSLNAIPLMRQNSQDGNSPSAGILLLSGSVTDGTSGNLVNGSTFISRDGGLTWEKVFDFRTRYVMGDYGNLIVAMPFNSREDDDIQSEFYYSFDQGYTWEEYQLEEEILPLDFISTTPDGSGVNFLLTGFSTGKNTERNFAYTIDFSEVFGGKKCSEQDMEEWKLNNGECVNGAVYSYRRRKQDAKCFVGTVFEDLQITETPCDDCTEKDYECESNFVRNEVGECVPDYNSIQFTKTCLNQNDEVISLPPKKLLAHNLCQKELKFDDVQLTCKNSEQPNKVTNQIIVTENVFDNKIIFYQFFDTSVDESLIISDSNGDVFISHDAGQSIQHLDVNGEKIVEIVFNKYFNSSAYLFGENGNLFITHDRGYSFSRRTTPETINLELPLDFHSTNRDTFIYYGGEKCKNNINIICDAIAYITRDDGDSFSELLKSSIHCEFAGSQYKIPVDKDLVICQVRGKTDNKKSLVASTDYFTNDKNILFENIIGYLSSDGYSIVAVPYNDAEVKAYITMDGLVFAEAQLPQELADIKQETITVVGTETDSIFLHVTTNNEFGKTYGDLMKSNSNGTNFVILQNNVNRDNLGQVDLEKVQGLEGIILINVVDNTNSLSNTDNKKIRTKITFNDGSDWSYMSPPVKDSEGNKYNCKLNSLDDCSLNLYGYTSRSDIRDTYSSGSALGMMFGVGNVGSELLPLDECSTFLTTDGGSSWREVAKGIYQWEFGDHGGVLILVPENKATDKILYSTDFGLSWDEYKFTEEPVVIDDIATVPQDSALRFLLMGNSLTIRGARTKTYTIDFSGIFDRQCNLDEEDFEYRSIVPSENDCLFGHKTEHLQKTNLHCFIGSVPLSKLTKITENCPCSRADFECDYNYYRTSDGTCKLVSGLTPAPAVDICKNHPDAIEYSERTGYRKIPLSTCEGGLKLDGNAEKHPCPGKEKEFQEKYAVGGRSFLLIFLVPFSVFIVAGWYVYDLGIRRNGGFSRFGEIRLGDDDLIENNSRDKLINNIVRSGLIVISSIYSAQQMLKHEINTSISRIRERLSGRRGPSYSSLLHDQFLDEADDLLTGHDEDANDLGSFIDDDNDFDIEDDGIDNATSTPTSANDSDTATGETSADRDNSSPSGDI